jgi:dTDP-4-dehydrorhamnose reductase
MRVVVLGASGMLGSMLVRVLAAERDLDVVASTRASFDAETSDDRALDALLDGAAWAINAIGVIKSYIHDTNAAEVERAIAVNARFPHRLARAAERHGASVLQIATDCVYAGTRGAYVETDAHDALDVYGKTKSLGEVPAPNVHRLRTSIIGPEPAHFVSLLEWFRRQPKGATVNGFVNHHWNGVTTLQFARVALALVRGRATMAGMQHLIPADTITKHDLLMVFRDVFDRRDLTIRRMNAADAIDRTLSTIDPVTSGALWNAAGYAAPPTIADMVRELGAWLATHVSTVGEA